MNIRIFDIESDGLLRDEPSKGTKAGTLVHCLTYYDESTLNFETVTDPEEIKRLFKEEGVIWCGHNIILFDFPYLKKILGVPTPKFLVDTIWISRYLYPEIKKHGLEEWGDRLGVKKPYIGDWSPNNIEAIKTRCETDVQINIKLWQKEYKFLRNIYRDDDNLEEFLKYLHFKIDCLREQEEEGLALDIPKINKLLSEWEPIKAEREAELESVMPKVAIKKTKKYKNATVDICGNLFTKGDLFFDAVVASGGKIVEEQKLFKITGWNDPNSASHEQLKEWLYTLGWVPENIKHDRNKETGEVKLIPQIKSKEKDGELCPSIKKLFVKEPKLEVLEGLFIITHRITVLKGFLRDQVGGLIYPSASGLTNTLRFKHKILVNLPAIYKAYGDDIRSCIIAKEGHVLIGSDLANIEDRTKRHFIYKYDSEYVEAMSVPGYDAHLELGILAGMLKQKEADWYKSYEIIPIPEQKTEYIRLKMIRNKAKVANFSATYKVGAETLSVNSGLTLKESRRVLKTYWERNHAILDVEKECIVREVRNTRWLQNPISKFWYSLRSDKDRFSTLNQGSAVFMFDMWVMEQRNLGLKIPFQYHDEDLLNVLENKVIETKQLINLAMDEVNIKIPLNVPVGCSINVGLNYAETH